MQFGLSRLLPRRFLIDLLRYYATGDAVARVAGGVGLHVIRFRMNHDCGASVGEERVRAVRESDVFVLDACVRFSFHIHREVQHVSGMVAFGILQPVLLTVGIEVWACGLEIGSIALGILMKVDGMLAGWKVVQVELKRHARSLLRQRDSADVLALSVFDFDFGFGQAGKSRYKQDKVKSDEGQTEVLHAGNYKTYIGVWPLPRIFPHADFFGQRTCPVLTCRA
jgi:hypothetical protein